MSVGKDLIEGMMDGVGVESAGEDGSEATLPCKAGIVEISSSKDGNEESSPCKDGAEDAWACKDGE